MFGREMSAAAVEIEKMTVGRTNFTGSRIHG
jgi:hypothetical protein